MLGFVAGVFVGCLLFLMIALLFIWIDAVSWMPWNLENKLDSHLGAVYEKISELEKRHGTKKPRS